MRAVRRRGSAWAIGALLIAAGCDARDATTQPTGPSAERREMERELVPPPRHEPPEKEVRAGLRERYPEITTFVDNFLSTCLAGDYAGYRKFVSRVRNPESRERFQAIYYAIRKVVVDTIEPLELPGVPGPAHLVTCQVEVWPDQPHSAKWQDRRIAIIVFPEDGDLRMAPAPSELQPEPARARDAGGAEAPTTSSRPATPDYPWEDSGG